MVNPATEHVRQRMIEVGGRMSQDLGMGRIVGQMLVYLYLRPGECSLDQIGEDLGLSKAAVSIAARQLESLGVIQRSWKKGDRKVYYRTADNIATALQQGLLSFIGQKVQALAAELDFANQSLERELETQHKDEDLTFVYSRVRRAKTLRDQLSKLMKSPLLRFFTS